jgi:hypothetical protein
VAEYIFEFRPPTGTGSKVVSERNDDLFGAYFRGGGDGSFGVADSVGELLESVFL